MITNIAFLALIAEARREIAECEAVGNFDVTWALDGVCERHELPAAIENPLREFFAVQVACDARDFGIMRHAQRNPDSYLLDVTLRGAPQLTRFELLDHTARVLTIIDSTWNSIRNIAQRYANEHDRMVYYTELGCIVDHRPVCPEAWSDTGGSGIFHRPQAG